MNIQGLIERYEKFKASKKKMTSVDLVLKDLRSLDEPESLPFKLKDVVGRIRGFDPITQAIWLNKILDELGSDYGLMKYRSGYEQGKIEGAWVGNQLKDADKIRQELNRPVIPQFVADWLEKCKNEEKSLLKSLLYTPAGVNSWVDNSENQETFARAYLDGYEIEKEKRYTVKLKGLEREKCYLNFNFGGVWLFYTNENFFGYRSHHTRKELEEAGFGGVFNSPLFEIEEVE